MRKFFFWFTYFIAVGAAWFHTYEVFAKTDPWYIAAMAATAIDIALAYMLYLLSQATRNQRNAALIGTFVFGAMSGMAQVIQRYESSGVAMPEWMRWVSLSLVPLATTGSVIILGVVKYFDKDGNGVPDFMERGRGRGQQQFPSPQPRSEQSNRESPRPNGQQRPIQVGQRQIPVNQNGGQPKRQSIPERDEEGQMNETTAPPFPNLVKSDDDPYQSED